MINRIENGYDSSIVLSPEFEIKGLKGQIESMQISLEESVKEILDDLDSFSSSSLKGSVNKLIKKHSAKAVLLTFLSVSRYDVHAYDSSDPPSISDSDAVGIAQEIYRYIWHADKSVYVSNPKLDLFIGKVTENELLGVSSSVCKVEGYDNMYSFLLPGFSDETESDYSAFIDKGPLGEIRQKVVTPNHTVYRCEDGIRFVDRGDTIAKGYIDTGWGEDISIIEDARLTSYGKHIFLDVGGVMRVLDLHVGKLLPTKFNLEWEDYPTSKLFIDFDTKEYVSYRSLRNMYRPTRFEVGEGEKINNLQCVSANGVVCMLEKDKECYETAIFVEQEIERLSIDTESLAKTIYAWMKGYGLGNSSDELVVNKDGLYGIDLINTFKGHAYVCLIREYEYKQNGFMKTGMKHVYFDVDLSTDNWKKIEKDQVPSDVPVEINYADKQGLGWLFNRTSVSEHEFKEFMRYYDLEPLLFGGQDPTSEIIYLLDASILSENSKQFFVMSVLDFFIENNLGVDSKGGLDVFILVNVLYDIYASSGWWDDGLDEIFDSYMARSGEMYGPAINILRENFPNMKILEADMIDRYSSLEFIVHPFRDLLDSYRQGLSITYDEGVDTEIRELLWKMNSEKIDMLSGIKAIILLIYNHAVTMPSVISLRYAKDLYEQVNMCTSSTGEGEGRIVVLPGPNYDNPEVDYMMMRFSSKLSQGVISGESMYTISGKDGVGWIPPHMQRDLALATLNYPPQAIEVGGESLGRCATACLSSILKPPDTYTLHDGISVATRDYIQVDNMMTSWNELTYKDQLTVAHSRDDIVRYMGMVEESREETYNKQRKTSGQ